MDDTGPGSLKCIVAASERPLAGAIEQALDGHVRQEDVRAFSDSAVLIYTNAPPSDVRDWLAPCLEDGESIFVSEFENWSGYGPAPDTRWLLRRGH